MTALTMAERAKQQPLSVTAKAQLDSLDTAIRQAHTLAGDIDGWLATLDHVSTRLRSMAQ